MGSDLLHQRVGLLDTLQEERDLGLAFLGPLALAIVEDAVLGADHLSHEVSQLRGRCSDFLQAGGFDPFQRWCAYDRLGDDPGDEVVAGVVQVKAVGGQRHFGVRKGTLAGPEQVHVYCLSLGSDLTKHLGIPGDIGIASRGVRPGMPRLHGGGRQDNESRSQMNPLQLAEQHLQLRAEFR